MRRRKAGLSENLPDSTMSSHGMNAWKPLRQILSHTLWDEGIGGKAMVISIDKATAVKMYDKVKKHWKDYREKLKTALQNTVEDEKRETLRAQIQYMEETDMAVVVSQSQNEIADLREKGVDIPSAPETHERSGSGHQIQRLR